MKDLKSIKIGIIGLGYVGLPLATEFGKKFCTVGYDINKNRVKDLLNYIDDTNEVQIELLKKVVKNKKIKNINSLKSGLYLSNQPDELAKCNFYIITVPTPIDKNNKPDLGPLRSSSRLVGKLIKKNDFVVYESTVYPGATREVCIPIIESKSNLKLNKDFFVGYSPERINPGDKKRTLTKILKVTSGSDNYSAMKIDEVYNQIIHAGTYLAPSIEVAEAAKVIENSQRDINIAFVNELAKIFNLMNIDTDEVLNAAQTKWNFLPFKPGLVGGHCIGVDPFYLAKKSQDLGYTPKIILSGRNLNDSMAKYVANQVLLLMKKNNISQKKSNVLILGVTFKENCPDFRNTKVIDIINELIDNEVSVDAYDPWVNKYLFKIEHGIDLIQKIKKTYNVIVLAVSHKQFLNINISKIKKQGGFVYDIKSFLKKDLVDYRL